MLLKGSTEDRHSKFFNIELVSSTRRTVVACDASTLAATVHYSFDYAQQVHTVHLSKRQPQEVKN